MKTTLTIWFLALSTFLPAQEVSIKVNQTHLDDLILSALEFNIGLDKLKIQIDATEDQLNMTKAEHLSLVSLSGNLNEFSIRELSGDNSIPNFYPRYNIGVNIRLNHFANVKGKKNLIAKDRQLIILESEEMTRQLEEEVTALYIEYLKELNFLNLQRRLEQFSLADFEASEQKFIQGNLTLEKYVNARDKYYANKMKLIEAEGRYMKAKSNLESIANTSLANLEIE